MVRKDVAQSLFVKCIRLLEQRLKIKIKTAVMSIDCDFGTFSYTLHDKLAENLLLQERTFHQDLVRLAMTGQVSGGIIRCGDCLGAGEIPIDLGGSLKTCPRCRGGGEVVLMLNREGEYSESSGSKSTGADNGRTDEASPTAS